MVLSSVLNQGSRLLRSPAVLGAAACRGTFRGQQAQGASPCAAAPAAWTTVRAVGVHHRTFWDWSGTGKGGDQGNSKGSGGAADDGCGGGSGGGIPRNGKGKPGGSSERRAVLFQIHPRFCTNQDTKIALLSFALFPTSSSCNIDIYVDMETLYELRKGVARSGAPALTSVTGQDSQVTANMRRNLSGAFLKTEPAKP